MISFVIVRLDLWVNFARMKPTNAPAVHVKTETVPISLVPTHVPVYWDGKGSIVSLISTNVCMKIVQPMENVKTHQGVFSAIARLVIAAIIVKPI